VRSALEARPATSREGTRELCPMPPSPWQTSPTGRKKRTLVPGAPLRIACGCHTYKG
jgi:hypothetical protein